ncbi:MAG TPA: hypothetical protein V6C46_10125 [Coleofasciculaceae cyanobacterium]
MPPLTIENDWKLNSFSRIIETARDRAEVLDAMMLIVRMVKGKVVLAPQLTKGNGAAKVQEWQRILDTITTAATAQVCVRALKLFCKDALRTVFGIDQEVDAFVRQSLKGELEDILCCGTGRQTFVPNGQHPSEWAIDGESERC